MRSLVQAIGIGSRLLTVSPVAESSASPPCPFPPPINLIQIPVPRVTPIFVLQQKWDLGQDFINVMQRRANKSVYGSTKTGQYLYHQFFQRPPPPHKKS